MRFVPSLLLLLILATSCGRDGEAPVVEAAELTGRWDLVEARRDNVKTNLLEGLYFVFGEGGRFETNLLTNEAQSGTYSRDGTEIVTTEVEAPMTYEIESLDEDELLLRSRYQGFLFDFRMERHRNQGGGSDAD
ncbi:hypothetical protein [Lewinella sp. JB7]|uniref:hypothetical protein n=1 Tax=Lewinella sp. JB7 TaxID=2962887 RepID=UPI0020C96A36|nr:hypothetical protein [Lewinella sp. JB7]MCP9235719.1 hypothetical protein [Lewinella sp. JB7]